jgi:hypothetical protein
MKIVINRCYGGFHLSGAALHRLAELRGVPCHLFRLAFPRYVPVKLGDDEEFGVVAYTVPEIPPIVEQDDRWYRMSDAEKDAHMKEKNRVYQETSICPFGIDRTDPLLVRVVEELGDRANGPFAELAVVEIPDGVEYTIEEYDGLETVCEKRRKWPEDES